MRIPRSHVVFAALLMLAGLLVSGLTLVSPAQAHEERPASFPDGSATRPTYLGLDNPRQRVVCKPDSGQRISRMESGALKQRNRELLLGRCDFGSI